MDATLQVALIAGIFNVLVVLISRWVSSREHSATQKVIANIELNVNGRLQELLRLTAKSSHAEGMKAEHDKKS